ncbi:short chain dehydrogenase [Erwinia sp. OLTSP20]|uniref:short chain dehydrogenase n=1 Tax=unclassified Erwinia TaxID=2622719 RepID=UPI000C175285|nr:MULTISPECIES: short chain dehydrogenase [unclassified Erwinia]PIJ50822.1 short chain dehydrogenase [Erwinia sp. OAMSP11]PIJ75439.1 short chain dehydrogenase [Erwinia sp. OLSSP12]PIJ81989.1 short chain dehydrogenase [Erwinia sp. OLCASP19]PIJ84644.1 short chain dehydrogenase [Erwinia sp. OLMTSP26]PIJ86993.1 short chain dehydrogenase [Erwinia sp. OLMDSP33]
MKIMVIGASGTVGKGIVENLQSDHEIIAVGRHSGDLQVDLTDSHSIQQLFSRSGKVDAIVAATGKVHFAPLGEMNSTQFFSGLEDKLMGQVRLVMLGKDYLNPGGSFTLTSGILAQQAIRGGVSAMTVNRALEGFVQSAALELSGQRINAVSPTILTEAVTSYGPFFPGFESASAARVALAYRRSIEGIESGKVYRVW